VQTLNSRTVDSIYVEDSASQSENVDDYIVSTNSQLDWLNLPHLPIIHAPPVTVKQRWSYSNSRRSA